MLNWKMHRHALFPLLAAALAACSPAPQPQPVSDFVTRQEGTLTLRGQSFHFVGTNNYYLSYQPTTMTDDVLNTAAAQGFSVMRTWGFMDIADPASTGNDGPKNGVYFQSFATTPPTVNEGASGLQRLDYVVAQAARRGLKLVIPLTNNWSDFGGMDAYVRARGLSNHDAFYTDATIRTWFKAYIGAVLNHKNTYTGVLYRDDPTIMMWELANEPRCGGSGTYPASAGCAASTVTAWADDVSGYIRAQDSRHLIGVGDEGFLCTGTGGSDYMYNCGAGVDGTALANLKAIDVISLHLYPDGWGKTLDWSTTWIQDHLKLAKEAKKAFLLGEFGLQNRDIRDTVYRSWTDTVQQGGGSGSLSWILSGKMDNGSDYYPDYDGFTVYCPSSTCTVLAQAAQRIRGAAVSAAPQANDDVATPLAAGATTTLDVLGNDTASAGHSLLAATLDLDATAPGIQTKKPVREGQFSAENGVVTFSSNGLKAAAPLTLAYTVQDSGGQTSNRASITVPLTGGSASLPVNLFSFEDGPQGWSAINGSSMGTVETSTAFQTDGAQGLLIHSKGDWFGVAGSTLLPLDGKSILKFDLRTLGAGTSYGLALQVGDAYTWCQGGFTWVQPGSTVSVSIDLTTYSCAGDFKQIHGLQVFFGVGDYLIDHVRAE